MEKNKNYWKAITFGFVIVSLIAIFDIYAMNSGVLGSPTSYAQGDYTSGWWGMFYNLVVVLLIVVAFMYYLLAEADISSSLAVFLVPYIMWIFGVADVLFFWFQKKMVPLTLPWLMNSNIIGGISKAIGQTTVTTKSLYFSAFLGVIIAFIVANIFRRINYKILKVKI